MSHSSLHIKRWYDQTPELSRAVAMMQALSPPMRLLIARGISQYARQRGRLRTSDDVGFRQAGEERIIGLMKGMAKKRWYDEDPVVRRAFNDLYLVNIQLRYEIAIHMIVAIKALEHCALKDLPVEKMKVIVCEVFQRETDELLQKSRPAPELSRSVSVHFEAAPKDGQRLVINP